ncbi:MAG: helix-turn-helix domain-containing protein [Deltaproteobacteria bacterium]|nr:helix-turn-helix domain-containing protein [Deltaproteobacteria bacterium]
MSESDDPNWKREEQLDRDAEREQRNSSTRASARRSTRAAPESREILCADQVAAWLGVDRKSVYNAVSRGGLPCQRLGKRLLFSRSALAAWMLSTASQANVEGVPK